MTQAVSAWLHFQTLTTLLLFTIQQIVLHQQLVRSQTLTALHDSVNAWSGLGSAILTLFRQLSIPAAVVPTLTTTIYLGCITILHITTGALFSLETFNITNMVDVPTQGLLDYSLLPTAMLSVPHTEDSISFLATVNQIHNTSSFVGLANGTVYDIIGETSATGTITVNATYFNISCGSVNGDHTLTTDNTGSVLFGSASQSSYGVIRALGGSLHVFGTSSHCSD